MKTGYVEVIVEVTLQTPQAIVVHDGGPSVWLERDHVQIFDGEPVPGMATVCLPRTMAVEKGLLSEDEDDQ